MSRRTLCEIAGSKRIEGLHEEPTRFPYATFADQLDDRGRDTYARYIQAKTIWEDTGRTNTRRFKPFGTPKDTLKTTP